ncbi:MAG: carboxypeptidase-like regulatory domain-containing protein [Prolixibacteraceae bacterium]|nr:carboxypeptidase-like regulatory domain-containing protein [Prolixibacteraceae bacterium]
MKNRNKSNILKILSAFILIFFLNLDLLAQPIQEKRINGKFQKVNLQEFFNALEKDYNIHFYYRTEWVKTYVVNQEFKDTPLIQVLNLLFDRQPLSFRFFQNNSVVVFPKGSDGRQKIGADEPQILVIGDPMNEGRYNSARIKGKVLDGKNTEPLAGAVVFHPQTGIGTTTNANGTFELDLPTGDHTLQVSFMGYEILSQQIKLIENGTVNFELFEESHNLEEVTVMGDDTKATKAQMSMVKVNSRIMKELPVLMGEADVIKSVVMMPGVKSVGEMSSGFNVRGGNNDQNLILMDGAPVFNTSHLFGFFSMINPDAVKDVTLFKGGIPASYGERISSIMDVQLKEGNTENLKFYGGIGLINSRFTLEGPFVKKKKSTFLIGGRSTYSDWIMRQSRNAQFMNSVAHFYDVNGTLNLSLGENNTLKLMGYLSNDVFNLNSNSLYTYGNTIGSLNWKMNLSKQVISNLSLAYSKYNFNLDQQDPDLPDDDYRLITGLEYGSTKYILSWLPNEKHRINTGFQAIGYKIRPGEIEAITTPTNVVHEKVANEQAIELGVFADDDIELSASTALNIGLRYAGFMSMGPATVLNYDPNQTINSGSVTDSTVFGIWETAKMYHGIEPRLALKLDLSSGGSVRMSYQRIHQFMNQISNTSVMSPADFWKSSDAHIRPLISDQFALGLFKTPQKGLFETSAEVYYKKLQNLPEYKNGAILVMNHHVEADLINANGYAYGLELYAKKNSGRLNGWVSYTYSRTMRKTDNRFPDEVVNAKKYYPSVYDKPHDLSTVMNYQISRRWRFSGNFVLSSGRPVTLPELKYTYGGKQVVYYSDRNKYRMPPYHRMDVSITLDENLRRKRMWKGSWTFSVYNLYGRKNPYSVFYRKDPSIQQTDKNQYAIYKLSVIGVPVPSITYNFKF